MANKIETYNGGVQWKTGASAGMTLGIDGNLGLGVTPSTNLEVSSATGPTIRLSSSDTSILSGDRLGRIEMYANDASVGGVGVGAYIDAISAFDFVGGYTPTNLIFGTGPAGGSNAIERMRIDSNGNVGIGVTPSAWRSTHKSIDIGAIGSIVVDSGSVSIANNSYLNTSSNWMYKQSGIPAMLNEHYNGITTWYKAPSGTAGNAITWTTAMTLDASGNLGLGTSSPITPGASGTNLTVSGTSAARLILEDTGYEATGDGVCQLQWDNGVLKVLTGSRSGTSTTSSSEDLVLDASGNLGVGAIPSGWRADYKALELGALTSLAYDPLGVSFMYHNAYRNSSNTYVYKTTGYANAYAQYNGNHEWLTAPSGTAGSALTWNTPMVLNSSGNLGLGVTPSAWHTNSKVIEIGTSTAIENYSVNGADAFNISNNAYRSTSSQFIYKESDYACDISMYDGAISFLTAPRGTAGNAITWNTALTVPNTGGIQLPNTAIANATTLDWYEEATATLTATGMTTSPTGTATLTRVGNTVTIEISSISGTSNDTTFTLTGIPTNFRPTVFRHCIAVTQDNGGSLVFARMRVNTDGTITLFKDAAGNAFTASGIKGVYLNTTTYHI